MPARKRLTKRDVESLGPAQVIWDGAVVGFCARRQTGPGITYALKARVGRKVRHLTIGRHGSPWTVDEARKEAQALLGRIAKGEDPSVTRTAMTVRDLCALYLSEAEGGRVLTRGRAKKGSTLAVDRGRIARHIVPLLGKMLVTEVRRADIQKAVHDIAAGKTAATIKTGKRGLARVTGGKTAATRVAGLLGAIFAFAIKRDIVQSNPVQGVEKFEDGKNDRRLSDGEYRRLGAAFADADETVWPPAVAMARFLTLTGWRTAEAANLDWSELDLPRQTAYLADTKSRKSVRPLARVVCELLGTLPGKSGRVFPSTRGEAVISFKKFWPDIRNGLPDDVTPHVLRHSFASVGGDLGYSESTIGAVVGHKGRATTNRYIHHADAVLVAAADNIADKIIRFAR